MSKKVPVLNIVLVVIGLALIVTSIVFKDKNSTLVDEAGNEIVQANSDFVKTDNEGKLIAVSGQINAGGDLADKYFGISKKTYKLKRVVEMYQYALDEDTNDYVKVWSEEIIALDSSDSEHVNPTSKAFNSEEYFETGLSLGVYALTDKLINDLPYDTVMGPDEISSLYSGIYSLSGEYITNTKDMNNPQIGDFRISYKYAKDKTATVVAKQAGNSFAPYYSSDKKEVYSIEEGEQTAEDFITSIKGLDFNANFIISLIGIAFACFGFASIVFANIKSKKVK